MEVGKVNNSTNFGARIVVKKTGFQNLGKDLVDTVELGSRTTGTVASSVGESTVFPSEISAGYGLSRTIINGLKKIQGKINDIFHRNIKTTALEDTENIVHSAKSVGNASYGSGLMTTGSGSYASSIGSGLDQSVNFPMYGSEAVPQMIAKSDNNVLKEVAGALENVAYDVLYLDNKGVGNEQAWLASSLTSGSGATLLGSGAKTIKNAGKTGVQVRNIPS